MLWVFPSCYCNLVDTITGKWIKNRVKISHGIVGLSYWRNEVQFSSVTQSCPTFCDSMDCSTQGFPVHHQLLEFTQTHVHWVSDAIQPSHPLLSPPPPASISSSMRVFSNVSVLHIRWSKYWSFSFSVSPSNEYSGLISFRIDWLDLLAEQGILESYLSPQFKSINSSALSFLMVQLSHPHMTTGKNHSVD